MRNASSEFEQILKEGAQSIVNYFDITLADSTVLHIGPDRVKAGSVSITEASTSGDYFELGSAIGKILSFSIINHDDLYSAYDFYNARVVAYDALTLSDNSVEKIRHGHYTVTTPESPGSTISITAVDSIYKFDKPYAANTTFPATLLTVLTDCCLDCGVGIGFSHFDGYNFQVLNKPTDCTYRQVVQWVAQIAGKNARMSDLDALELVFYEFDTSYIEGSAWGGNFDANTPYATGDNLWGGNFDDWTSGDNFSGGTFDNWVGPLTKCKDVVVSTDDIVITGISIVNGDNETSAGDSAYQLTVKDNPLTVGKETEILEYLAGKFIGLSYRPYSLKEKSNPLYTTNDIVRVPDIKGRTYPSIINYIVYKPGGYSQLSAKAENPIKNSSMYPSESSTAVANAKKYTEEQLSNYDKQVQLMDSIAVNALGYHKTVVKQPDNSDITYLHDKPMLEDSVTIWKISLDGFFVSQDGGETYVYGFTEDGRAVVNILSAIGIVCDWIRGGTLTLGGDNDTDGVCVVYDAEGAEVARLDKGGLKTNSAEITGGKIDISTSSSSSSIITIRGSFGSTQISGAGISQTHPVSGGNETTGVSPGLIRCGGPVYYTYVDSGSIYSRRSDVTKYDMLITSDESLTVADILSSNYIQTTGGVTNVKLGQFQIEQLYAGGNSTVYFGSSRQTNITGSGRINAASLVVDSSGTKSKIAATKNYGERLFYCYETPKPYFGDIGEAVLDENGICYVQIDDIFYETVNTSCNYQVFLQKQGQGDLWVKERTPTHFIVEGTPNLSFAWEIKARQAGFEYERLDKFEKPTDEQIINYELEAIDYITNYYKELEKI